MTPFEAEIILAQLRYELDALACPRAVHLRRAVDRHSDVLVFQRARRGYRGYLSTSVVGVRAAHDAFATLYGRRSHVFPLEDEVFARWTPDGFLQWLL